MSDEWRHFEEALSVVALSANCHYADSGKHFIFRSDRIILLCL